MATSAKSSAGAEAGTGLPEPGDVEQAERLRIVPDGEFLPEAIDRISLDDLEERRLRANGR
jgi:hypothetical protein